MRCVASFTSNTSVTHTCSSTEKIGRGRNKDTGRRGGGAYHVGEHCERVLVSLREAGVVSDVVDGPPDSLPQQVLPHEHGHASGLAAGHP